MIFGDVVQKLTNDEDSEDTNIEKVTNNTEEKCSQTVMENQECTMLIPLNTSLTIFGPTFIKKLRNGKIIKLVFIYIISLIIVAFSIGQIFRLNHQKTKTLELATEIRSYIKENEVLDDIENVEEQIPTNRYTVDFEGLKKINPDTRGWLKVNGVGIWKTSNCTFPDFTNNV